MHLLLEDEAATERLGEACGRLAEPGDVIALVGDLGSGKTTFVRGLARGLEVPPEVAVASPTFTLVNEYSGRLSLYHLDLYRVGREGQAGLGLDEYLYGDGVAAVEWAERLAEMPPVRLEIRLGHFPPDTGEHRLAEMVPFGERGVRLVEGLAGMSRDLVAPEGLEE
ncbi:MAG: tRNA (adenosine(37)-N6)-threonylcarbamoyltransferase complex ATPase subunit type 1 TsaE [Pseudomonadota bacterium]